VPRKLKGGTWGAIEMDYLWQGGALQRPRFEEGTKLAQRREDCPARKTSGVEDSRHRGEER